MAKSRSIGRHVFLFILVAGLGGGAWWYFKGRPEAGPIYQTVTLQKGSIVQAVTATGQLQPVIIVDVGSQVSGRLREVLVDFNDKVAKDQVLARIDPATFESALAQAESELLNAKANLRLQRSNLERSRQLAEQKLVSSADLEQIEATVEQAEAGVRIRESAVQSRKTDLQRCTIVAPIDGMVISRAVQTGQTVAASLNSPILFTIANDLTKMQIAASVSEADVGNITDGLAVKFTVDAFPGRNFTGKVKQVRNAATIVENVVTYETIIAVDNPGGRLKPGMTANVSIIIQSREEALRLANAALRVRLPEGLKVPPPPEPARPARGKASS
ncbi:MAG: efflux RND transporter periplasmic adaptor subunit, partial [Opitutaceae bacterium]